jgi:hypothetical protein
MLWHLPRVVILYQQLPFQLELLHMPCQQSLAWLPRCVLPSLDLREWHSNFGFDDCRDFVEVGISGYVLGNDVVISISDTLGPVLMLPSGVKGQLRARVRAEGLVRRRKNEREGMMTDNGGDQPKAEEDVFRCSTAG